MWGKDPRAKPPLTAAARGKTMRRPGEGSMGTARRRRSAWLLDRRGLERRCSWWGIAGGLSHTRGMTGATGYGVPEWVTVAPGEVDHMLGLVHEPPITRHVATGSSHVDQQRGEPLHPAVDGDGEIKPCSCTTM